MADNGVKLVTREGGIPNERDPVALMAGVVPQVPVIRQNVSTKVGEVLSNAALLSDIDNITTLPRLATLPGPVGGGVTSAFGRVGLTLSGTTLTDLPRLTGLTPTSRPVFVTGSSDFSTLNLTPSQYINLSLRGPGNVTGLPGKSVTPEIAPADQMECLDLIPETMLQQLNSVANPVIDVIGDSLSTLFANSIGFGNNLFSLIDAHLRRQFVGRNLTINSRAIGGIGWISMDSPISRDNLPPWYDPSKKLVDVVRNDRPDALIVLLGMNLSPGGNIGPMRRFLAAVNAWDKVPNIVFGTNFVPRPNTQAGVPAWDTQVDQHKREEAAGLTRTFAHAFGYGLLDFNRKQFITERGFDPTSASFRRGVGAGVVQPIAGNAYLGQRLCRHFGVKMGFDPSKLARNTSQVISVQIGACNGDVLQISKFGATENDYLFSWFTGANDASASGDTWNYAQDNVKLYPDTNGNIYIRTESLNGVVSVYPETRFPVAPFGEFSYPIARRLGVMHGGEYRPQITEATPSSSCVNYAEFYYGDDRLNGQGITTDVMWGNGTTLEGSPGDGPNGGSSYNHYSSWAMTHIVTPVLNQSRFVSARSDTANMALLSGFLYS